MNTRQSIRPSLSIAAAGACLLLAGCSVSEKFAKSMVNTQKVVAYKDADYADPVKIVGEHAVVYSPQLRNAGGLLETYAPIVVQELTAPKENSYSRDSDKIGTPELNALGDMPYSVRIDTEKPALYASVETTQVYGTELQQLVYVFWYPRHPVGLVEKGDIDGGVLRITLDADQRPSIYEFVGACGCFHGVFVTQGVESAAREEYHALVQGKKRFVERDVDNEDDWRVRDLVHNGAQPSRPVIFMSAGKHQCEAIQTTDRVSNLKRFEPREYSLKDYSNLERLPVTNSPTAETASMFNPQGLIWGGQRKGEEKMFSKLDHGGWPRRLSAMKIHWDQEAWNDKDLLEKYLRLPHSVVKPSHTATKR